MCGKVWMNVLAVQSPSIGAYNSHGIGFPAPKVLACRETHLLLPFAELTLVKDGHLPTG